MLWREVMGDKIKYLWNPQFNPSETHIIDVKKGWFLTASAVKEKGKENDVIRISRWQKRNLDGDRQYDFALKPKSGFTIKNNEQRLKIKAATDRLTGLSNSSIQEVQIQTDIRSEKDWDTFYKMQEKLKKQEELISKQKDLLGEKENLIKKERKKRQKQKHSKWTKELREFKSLMKRFKKKEKGIKEEDIQKKLIKSHWMFGLDYEKVIPKKEATSKSIPDFYLIRYDTFEDILELKLPTDKLFTKKGELYAKLGKTISQVINYLEDLNAVSGSKRLSKRMNVEALKPKAFIIMGSYIAEEDRERLRILNSYLKGITIMTYDDLQKKADTILKTLK